MDEKDYWVYVRTLNLLRSMRDKKDLTPGFYEEIIERIEDIENRVGP